MSRSFNYMICLCNEYNDSGLSDFQLQYLHVMTRFAVKYLRES